MVRSRHVFLWFAVPLLLALAGCAEGVVGNTGNCPDAENDACAAGADAKMDPDSGDGKSDTADAPAPVNCDEEEMAGCPCDYNNSSLGVCADGTFDENGNCGKPAAYEDDETECDDKDNDCNGIVDEGCRCNYKGKAEGVCEDAGVKDDQGNCPEPSTYESDEFSCKGRDNDCDGAVDEGCECDYDGKSTGVCSGGTIDMNGDCGAPSEYERDEQTCDGLDNDCDNQTDEADGPIGCQPGETREKDCGSCGKQVRTCQSDCTWSDWSGCQSQGECTPGDTQSGSCGDCGTQTRTCTQNCTWGGWSACSGEGTCSPGDTQTSGCPTCQARKCTNSCSWSNSCTECTCTGFQQCGYSCPTGYHATSYSCDFSCGSCGTSDNAVRCEPNCGSRFTACGYSCPTGYHVTGYICDFNCGSCGTSNNAVTCQRD